MFGFGKAKDDAVLEAVCTKLRPVFGILEHRLGEIPEKITNDPYVLGYIIGCAVIFAQIETSGKASSELRGKVSLAALQTAFSSLKFSMAQASSAMNKIIGEPEAKRGSDAADLVITALGFDAEDLPVLFGAPDLNVTRWGTIRVDHKTQMTNLEGVFAIGDIVRGASLVVWAIRDGRDVTEHMHNYLKSKASREKVAA